MIVVENKHIDGTVFYSYDGTTARVCMEFVVSRDPLLRFEHLLPSLSRKLLPCPVEGRETTYHFWARNALYHGLRFLGLSSGNKVLVPAFHCRTVVEPVIQFGCEVVFYNIHQDGTVDFEDLRGKIDSQTKALLAIHYFGVLQPVQQLQKFCHEHGLFLIEDCAHILCGDIDGEAIGSFGDISIFSWRKFFPMPDGGVLVRNRDFPQASIDWERLTVWGQMKIIKNLIEQAIHDSTRQEQVVSLHADMDVSLSEVSSIEGENVLPQVMANNHQVAEFDYSQVNWPMSQWSQSILKNIDLPSIVQKRKDNTKALFSAMNELADIHPWGSVGATNICTWAFPVVATTRRDLHVKLRKRGIQAFSWDGVIHPALALEKFPEAKFLYEHLVLLPNQQSLSQHDIHLVIEGVKDVLSNGGCSQQAVQS